LFYLFGDISATPNTETNKVILTRAVVYHHDFYLSLSLQVRDALVAVGRLLL